MLPRLAAVLHSLKDEVRALREEVNALKEARSVSPSESPVTAAPVTAAPVDEAVTSPTAVDQPAGAAPVETPALNQ